MSKLREQVEKMAQGEEVNPKDVSIRFDPDHYQFNNLILDELVLEQLTADDKAYLEEFIDLEMLALNSTKLSSTANFPSIESLTRVSTTFPS